MEMLKRKIDKYLIEWRQNTERFPLIIKGARQIGKTASIMHFAKGNYKNIIYINFVEEKNYKDIFDNAVTELIKSFVDDEQYEAYMNGSQKEINKGESMMNNDILKEFNIPTEPIMDDSESILFEEDNKVEVQPIEPPADSVFAPVNDIFGDTIINPSIQPINPGFMDIDKIQNEAQDIIKEPAPIADMDNLLKPDMELKPVMDEVSQPLPVEQEQVEQQPRMGKFFNMFSFSQPEKDENFVENVEEKRYQSGPKPTISLTKRSSTIKNVVSGSYCKIGPLSVSCSDSGATYSATAYSGSGGRISCSLSGNTNGFYVSIPMSSCSNGVSRIVLKATGRTQTYTVSVEKWGKPKYYPDNGHRSTCQTIKDRSKKLVNRYKDTEKITPTASVEWTGFPGIIQVVKKDYDSGRGLSSVKIRVNGTTKTTDSSGKVTYENLSVGSYTIEETSLPPIFGYTEKAASVTKYLSSGMVYTCNMSNVKQTGNLIIYKRDYDVTSEKLANILGVSKEEMDSHVKKQLCNFQQFIKPIWNIYGNSRNNRWFRYCIKHKWRTSKNCKPIKRKLFN